MRYYSKYENVYNISNFIRSSSNCVFFSNSIQKEEKFVENSGSNHFSHSNSGHPITAQVATADGFPMVASYDPLNGQIDYFSGEEALKIS